eukprot:PhF_6_TR4522/c0_g1_i1/m.6323
MSDVFRCVGYNPSFVWSDALTKDFSQCPGPGNLVGHDGTLSVVTIWQQSSVHAPSITLDRPSCVDPNGAWRVHLSLYSDVDSMVRLSLHLSTAFVITCPPGMEPNDGYLDSIFRTLRTLWTSLDGGYQKPRLYLIAPSEESVAEIRNELVMGRLRSPCKIHIVHRWNEIENLLKAHPRPLNVYGGLVSPQEWLSMLPRSSTVIQQPHLPFWKELIESTSRSLLENAIQALRADLDKEIEIEFDPNYNTLCNQSGKELLEFTSHFPSLATSMKHILEFNKSAARLTEAHALRVVVERRERDKKRVQSIFQRCDSKLRGGEITAWDEWIKGIQDAVVEYCHVPGSSADVLLDTFLQWVLPNCGVVHNHILRKQLPPPTDVCTPQRQEAIASTLKQKNVIAKQRALNQIEISSAETQKENVIEKLSNVTAQLQQLNEKLLESQREFDQEAQHHKVTKHLLVQSQEECHRLRLDLSKHADRKCNTCQLASLTIQENLGQRVPQITLPAQPGASRVMPALDSESDNDTENVENGFRILEGLQQQITFYETTLPELFVEYCSDFLQVMCNGFEERENMIVTLLFEVQHCHARDRCELDEVMRGTLLAMESMVSQYRETSLRGLSTVSRTTSPGGSTDVPLAITVGSQFNNKSVNNVEHTRNESKMTLDQSEWRDRSTTRSEGTSLNSSRGKAQLRKPRGLPF